MSNIAVLKKDDYKFKYIVENKATSWRAQTLMSKEPDTIAWIEAMPKEAIFADIGANVGMYSIYAGVRGLKVFAFEPEAQNYALLCRNMRENAVQGIAYCVALSDKNAVDMLYMSTTNLGDSCHTFGQSVDHNLHKRTNCPMQGCIAMRLDDFGISADHIKIDVDGLEHIVVAGGEKTIKAAKSVLVEINTQLPEHMALVDKMRSFGFTTDDKQIKLAQRTEGHFAGCGNYIFTR